MIRENLENSWEIVKKFTLNLKQKKRRKEKRRKKKKNPSHFVIGEFTLNLEQKRKKKKEKRRTYHILKNKELVQKLNPLGNFSTHLYST